MDEGHDLTLTETLPALSLGRTVLFPGMKCPVVIRNTRAYETIHAAVRSAHRMALAVFAARVGLTPDPNANVFFEVGTLARVTDVFQCPPCRHWVAELEGAARVRALSEVRNEPFREVRVRRIPDPYEEASRVYALATAIREAALESNRLFPRCWHTIRAIERLNEVREPAEFPGAVIDLLLSLPVGDRQRLLETEPLSARLEVVLDRIHERVSGRWPDALLH